MITVQMSEARRHNSTWERGGVSAQLEAVLVEVARIQPVFDDIAAQCLAEGEGTAEPDAGLPPGRDFFADVAGAQAVVAPRQVDMRVNKVDGGK
jgi:hypothetical protein